MELNEVKEGLRAKVSRFASDVEPVYKVLNWTWGFAKEPPTSDEIAKTLNELIDMLNEPTCCGTGGLEVFWEDNNNGTEIGRCYGIRFTHDDIRFYN